MAKELSNVTIATQLYSVQQEKALLEAKEKELKDTLLAALKAQGVRYVRLDNGTSFNRSHRETLKVKNDAKAMAWAEKNYCVKIDTTKAMKILRRDLVPLPKFFERVIGEDYLTVKRAGEQDDE